MYVCGSECKGVFVYTSMCVIMYAWVCLYLCVDVLIVTVIKLILWFVWYFLYLHSPIQGASSLQLSYIYNLPFRTYASFYLHCCKRKVQENWRSVELASNASDTAGL